MARQKRSIIYRIALYKQQGKLKLNALFLKANALEAKGT